MHRTTHAIASSSRLDFQEVIAAVRRCDLRQALSLLGHEVGRNGFLIQHPWREESKSSIHVRSDAPSRWHDFGATDDSKEDGDLIDFIRHSQSLAFDRAVLIAAAVLGIGSQSLASRRSRSRDSQTHDARTHARRDIDLETFVNRAQQALAGSETARAFLRARGIDPDGKVARHMRVGVIDEAALKVSSGTATPWYLGRVVFPYMDRQGLCRGFNARTISLDASGSRYMKARGLQQSVPYNASSVRSGEAVVIVEGELDALAVLTSLGASTAVVATGGGALKRRHVAHLSGVSSAHLLFDRDDAGLGMARSAAELLTKSGIHSVTLSLPDSIKDPSDFLVHHGPDVMREWLANRRTLHDDT